ncbi:MAG TPA: F0F1 ATP synthase subunit alpha, partial [Candidatus Omnitrophota bacterium]|nr:F0F1 ATP synthase subunit alpha [Candidatus Omnitrophota bacterium]
TFFPMVELLEGDVTGYIPTNLISMTDGQILLSTQLFSEGFKPAIDLGLSVSRIGSKVQWKAMRKVAGKLRLNYLQYRQKLQMSKLQSGERSKEFIEQMKEGEILTELLIQDKDNPRPMVEQIMLFYGLNKKIFHNLEMEQIRTMKTQIYDFTVKNFPDFVREFSEKKELLPQFEKQMDNIFAQYFKSVAQNKTA